MNKLQPVGTPEQLEEYRLWREQQMTAARKRAQSEGDQPPQLTAKEEAALDRVWNTWAEEVVEAEELAA